MQNGQVIGGGSGPVVKVIYRGTIVLNNATSAQAVIAAVVLANSRIRLLGVTINNNTGDSTKSRLRLELTDTTHVTVYSNTADAANIYTVSYEVTEYYPGAFKSIQRGTITCVAGASTAAVVTAVDTTKSELSHLGATATVNLGSNLQHWTPKLVLTDATHVTADAGGAIGTDYTIGYEVVEFY